MRLSVCFRPTFSQSVYYLLGFQKLLLQVALQAFALQYLHLLNQAHYELRHAAVTAHLGLQDPVAPVLALGVGLHGHHAHRVGLLQQVPHLHRYPQGDGVCPPAVAALGFHVLLPMLFLVLPVLVQDPYLVHAAYAQQYVALQLAVVGPHKIVVEFIKLS